MIGRERWIGCMIIDNNLYNIYTTQNVILNRSLHSDRYHIWAMKKELHDRELPDVNLESLFPDLSLEDLKSADHLVKVLGDMKGDIQELMIQRTGEVWRHICRIYQNPIEFLVEEYQTVWHEICYGKKMIPVMPARGSGSFAMERETLHRLKNLREVNAVFNREVGRDVTDLVGVKASEKALKETLLKYGMLSEDTVSSFTLKYRGDGTKSDDAWDHMGLTNEGGVVAGLARTTFVPKDFSVKGERYAGVEVKGYNPTSEEKTLIILPCESGFYVAGGLQLIHAVTAFRTGMQARKHGKVDPLPIAASSLLARCDASGGILEGAIDGKRDAYEELGIYVRGRKTNLQLSHLESVYDDLKRATGLTDRGYFELFIRNMVRDYISLVDAGFSVDCLHSGNLSIIGTIKDEDEWAPYNKSARLGSNGRLAANIGYLFEHARRVGAIAKVEYPEDSLYETISEFLGKRIKCKKEIYYSLKEKLVRKEI